MCAPTKDLAKIALIAGAAYATGGTSLTATTAATTASTATTAASTAFNWSGMFSTLSNVAKIAAPIIGAAGTVYAGVLQSNALIGKANQATFESAMSAEAYALRKIRRQREMIVAIGKQRAMFGLTGTLFEGTAVDVLGSTSAKFAEDQYYDLFNTSQTIMSKEQSAKNYMLEADAAVKGGYIKAGTTLLTRGDSFSKPIKDLFGGTATVDMTATEGSS
jgi:hypothetical protein